MLTVSSLALLLPVLGSATSADAAVGLQVRDTAGLRPQGPNQKSSMSNFLILTPLGGVRLSSSRTSFVLRYRPQLTFQAPSPIDSFRPLYLHGLVLDYATSASPRLSLRFNITGTFGEISYATQSLILDPGSSTINTTEQRVVRGRGSAGLTYNTSARNSLSFSATGGYQKGISSPDLDPTQLVPESFDATLILGENYQISRRVGWTLTTSGTFVQRYQLVYRDIDPNDPTAGQELDTVESQVTSASVNTGVGINSGPNSSVSVLGGAAVSRTTSRPDVSVFPTLSVTHSTSYKMLKQIWTNSLQGGVRGFVDAANGSFRPLLNLSWGMSTTIYGSWGVGAQFFASTSLTAEPLVPPTYETTARLSLPFSYQINNQLNVNWGVTGATRRGHLLEINALVPQRELTGFIGIKWTAGTDSTRGSWL
jgi:hypothetical protein